MEKDVFVRYVEMLHRFEELSKDGKSINSDTIEASTILEIRQLVENNKKLMELLKRIHALPDNERMAAVEEYFSKQNKKEEEPEKSEEEEIAKTFGVNVSEIDHKYLKNGHEIFSFYDSISGKQVILENNKKGKSLVECLQEIQEKNEKYQTDDEYDNSKSILKDKVNSESLELKMYTKEEILSIPGGLDSIRNEDAMILSYLLKHYDELGIKGINLDNLIYIDKDNKIQEAVVVDNKVMVGEPEDAKGANTNGEISEENEDNPELVEMVEEDTTEEKEKEEELDNEREKEKPKVLTKQDDKYGFISNVLLVSIITAVILVGVLIYYVVQYYS